MTTRTLSRLLLMALSLTFCAPPVATAQLSDQLRSMRERRKAGEMLGRARDALDAKNVELAEWYLDRIDKMDVNHTAVFGRSENPEALRAQIAQMKAANQVSQALAEDSVVPPTKPARDVRVADTQLTPASPPTNLQRTPASNPPAAAPKPAAAPQTPAPVVAQTPKARAQRLLARAWSSLSEGNVNASVAWYQQALACEATFTEQEFSPEDLAAEFRKRNVDLAKALAATSNSSAAAQTASVRPLKDPAAKSVATADEGSSRFGSPLDPALVEADKITSSRLLERGAKLLSAKDAAKPDPGLEPQRQAAVALLAQAQAALDRDDLAVAQSLVKQATRLNVPDVAFHQGDPRPWMLQMELDKRTDRITASTQRMGDPMFNAPPMTAQQSLPTVEMQGTNPHIVATPAQPPGASPYAPLQAPSYAQQNYGHATQTVYPPQVAPQAYPHPGYVQQPYAQPAYIPQPGPQQFAAPPMQTPQGYPSAPPAFAQQAPQAQQVPPHAPNNHGVGGLVYNPGVDDTRNALASGQQPLPVPEDTMQSLEPPQAATPFPLPQTGREAPAALVPEELNLDEVAEDTRLLGEGDGPRTALVPPQSADVTVADTPAQVVTPSELDNDPTDPLAPIYMSQGGADTLPQPQGQSNEMPGLMPSLTETGAPTLAEPTPANPSQTPPPFTPPVASQDSPGYELFNQGQEALVDQEFGKALELLREAWEYEEELDPEIRQALQDNLQIARNRAGRSADENPDAVAAAPEAERAAERFINEISRQQATVRALRQTNPTKAWDELKRMRESLQKAELDETTRQQLVLRVDRQIDELQQYVESNRSRIENDARNQRILEEMDRRQQLKIQTQQQLAEIFDEFNQLMDQQRFPEATILAKKARELDPRNPVVETMMFKTNTVRQIQSKMLRDEHFNREYMAHLDDIDLSANPMSGDIEFPFDWDDLSKRRKRSLENQARRFTEVEQEIRRALKSKVDVQFSNMPLAAVVEHLAKMAGVNAYLDPEGLSAEGISSDTPINISLRKPVSLKSALNLILQPLHLSYVIQDEVLRITSEQVREGDVYTQVYPVADLVLPVPDFFPNNNVGLTGAIREGYNVLRNNQTLGGYSSGALLQGPLTIMQDEMQQPAAGNASVLSQMAAGGLLPQSAGPGGTARLPGANGGAAQADFDTLIELIQTTVEPDSWEELGGEGAIDGFQGNLSLVVSQTQDVHDQIADLLEQLRRLQDLQVTIEVRFIALNDDFFERIGVDFDFDIDDNTGLTNGQNTQNGAPVGVAAIDDDGPNITIGLDPAGMPTVDLDIPFAQDSFGRAVPQFGGFDANSAATIGFAILSDIEAFFLIEAVQGDSRTNVLQAPKVTLFNGQTASVQDQAFRPFVTSVIPVVGDFAAAQQPVITVLAEGTSLNVRGVVSQDRRFIRLDLVPFFSEIQDVDTFTFDGAVNSDTGTTVVDPTDPDTNVMNNAMMSAVGTTVQLPTLAFTTVNTTVSVPDGGTILLGGIKRLREGRTEQGVPMLSKLPYINRLFTNVGIGRETQSLMMMVTPRIIIQEEEEAKLLGTQP